MDMQHVQVDDYAAQTCSTKKQHGFTVLTCSLDMYCISEMQLKHAARICSMDMQHRYATWKKSVGMKQQKHRHARWTCSINMGMPEYRTHQELKKGNSKFLSKSC
jgi:hypothetical protein